MPDDDLSFLSLAEAARRIRSRELSPVELTRHCLDRIAAIDGKLNSFVTVTADLAVEQARAAEAALTAGSDVGPLHGVPIALKDLYGTKGVRTTAHSKVLLDNVPAEDAATTALLARAGTVLLGKLAMHEFAFGTPGFDTPFPPARNPWNPEHVTGGSSSGSGAALAAGLCYGSLGSDTGGSIRIPAAHCGIVGLKPTYGRVSRYGVVPLSWSLDHAGPMARTVEDTALILAAIAGYDHRDPASADAPVADYTGGLTAGVSGLRLGVPRAWFDHMEGTDPEVMSAFESALEVLGKLGAELVTLDSEPFIESRPVNMTILIAEAYAYHEETLRSRRQDYGEGVRNSVLAGAFYSAADYIQAQRARGELIARFREIFRDVDAVLSPTMARPAGRFDTLDPAAAFKTPNYSNAFNLSGLPAISVPCGFSSEGLPIGLQVAGRAFEEATVLRIAHAYEQATPWHVRHPSL